MAEQPSVKEQAFFEEHAREVEAHINANPEVVASIKRARAQDPKTMVSAKKFFSEHGTDV